MSIDPFTGRNPPYCFVNFVNPNIASQAMQELQGALILNRPVKINSKTEKRSRPTAKRDLASAGDWRSKNTVSNRQDHSSYEFGRWRWTETRDHFFSPTKQCRRLYVGGLPKIMHQDTLNSQMHVLFKERNPTAVSKLVWPVQFYPHRDQRCYCFVDFETATEAQAAQKQLDGQPMACGGIYRISVADCSATQKVYCEQAGMMPVIGRENKE